MAEPAAPVVRLRGRGAVLVPAYGIADAEHLVEKEIGQAWPGARVEVLEVARAGEAGRIVEEFAVSYRVVADVAVPPETENAPGVALRHARSVLDATRYRRTAWEVVTPPAR